MNRELPKNLTFDMIIEAVEADDNIGYCLSCGEIAHCEPDCRKGICDNCGEDDVYGAEELLIMYGV